MPRPPRYELVGIPQHVIQRGNNRQATFFADEDYRAYLGWLGEAAESHGCAIHAYVLMTNHVHLLLTPREIGVGLEFRLKIPVCPLFPPLFPRLALEGGALAATAKTIRGKTFRFAVCSILAIGCDGKTIKPTGRMNNDLKKVEETTEGIRKSTDSRKTPSKQKPPKTNDSESRLDSDAIPVFRVDGRIDSINLEKRLDGR